MESIFHLAPITNKDLGISQTCKDKENIFLIYSYGWAA